VDVVVRHGKAFAAVGRAPLVFMIDLQTRRILHKFSTRGTPNRLSLHGILPLLYVAGRDSLEIFNWEKREAASEIVVQGGGGLDRFRPFGTAIVLPHGRSAFFTAGNGTPAVGFASLYGGTAVLHSVVETPEGSSLLPQIDLTADRVYGLGAILTTDFQPVERGGGIQTRFIPHPAAALLFSLSTPGRVAIWDEGTYENLGEVAVSEERILSLCVGKDSLFTLDSQHLSIVNLQRACPEMDLPQATRRVSFDPTKRPTEEDVARAQKLLEEAKATSAGGNHERALEKAQEAIRLDPYGPGAALLGQLHMKKKNSVAAWSHLSSFLKAPFRTPNGHAEVVRLAAVAKFALSEGEEGLALLREGHRWHPGEVDLALELANHLEERGALEEAWRVLSRTLAEGRASKVKSALSKITDRLQDQTKESCATCWGEGSVKVPMKGLGEDRYRRERCGTCKGKRRVWKQPCSPCDGTGVASGGSACEPCAGKGFTPEPY
jgi:hypothetical protein